MKDSIYMKTLEIGSNRGQEGVTFNEIAKELNIDFSNDHFTVNFTIWFYTNFYNSNLEYSIISHSNSKHIRINEDTLEHYMEHNDTKSYIKGDALNKYIDFLELKRTRESSIKATYFASASLFIATLSIIIPIVFPQNPIPQKEIVETIKRNDTTKEKVKDSFSFESGKEKVSDSKTKGATKLDSVNNLN